MARRGLDGADHNNDGAVSRAEFMAMPYRMFDRLDADGDGVISTAEMQTVRGRGGN